VIVGMRLNRDTEEAIRRGSLFPCFDERTGTTYIGRDFDRALVLNLDNELVLEDLSYLKDTSHPRSE